MQHTHTRASRSIRTAVAVLTHLALACSGGPSRSVTAPSPGRPPELPSNPPSYSLELPGGGRVGLRFVAFQPARGAQFIPGEGAYVTVQVYAPEEKLMLDVSAEGWDGARPVQTSFWPRRSSQFICPSNPGFNSKQFLIGYDRSTRTPYPQRGDPDVPFVRVELRVRPFDQACAPPTVIPGTPTVPIIEAVERLDWRRP